MKTYLKPQDIIKMNLELQTVQRGLTQLGVYKHSVEVITSEKFLKNFQLWEAAKQEKFTRLVSGGAKYYKTIKGFLTKEKYENVI